MKLTIIFYLFLFIIIIAFGENYVGRNDEPPILSPMIYILLVYFCACYTTIKIIFRAWIDGEPNRYINNWQAFIVFSVIGTFILRFTNFEAFVGLDDWFGCIISSILLSLFMLLYYDEYMPESSYKKDMAYFREREAFYAKLSKKYESENEADKN